MIKYIGSKRALIPWISSVAETIRNSSACVSAADLFSGTSRVGHAFKRSGLLVTANDSSAYGFTLARCLIEADGRDYTPRFLQPFLDRLNAVPGRSGWFTDHYARQSRYFTVENARRIDAIRSSIDDEAGDDEVLKSVLLASLMLAADKVDSTVGVQMAYLKSYAPRASNPLTLLLPPILPGYGHALSLDAAVASRAVTSDLIYLDPPYNQHSYLGNYHIWETLVRNDEPEVYGIACKRIDVQTRKSDYNSKVRALDALTLLLSGLGGSHVLLSFSDEGYIDRTSLLAALHAWGPSLCLARGHDRYVGARIGIHSPEGKKVGKVSHTRNVEYLFVASRDPAALAAVRKAHGKDLFRL